MQLELRGMDVGGVRAEAEFLRLRARVAGLRAGLALRRFELTFARCFAEDQPRKPAGVPGGGQWTSGGGGDAEAAAGFALDPLIILAGGIDPGDTGKTVQEFMSTNCKGTIRAEMPGQFLDTTIGEIQSLAKSGDADARTCLKLLSRDKYIK